MPQTAEFVLDRLREDAKLGAELAHVLHLPPEQARFAAPEKALPEALQTALAAGGVDKLWQHQALGLDAVRRGENVLVTTPTASGKSLIFQLPVLERAAEGGQGKALFLFPLKALGQDQKTKFDALAAAAGLDGEVAGCEIYDGDTPRNRRQKIKRKFPRVIVSNPDMLHLGILSYWQGWTPFLSDLRWIVLDELHAYRGVFGSHFHHVLQRLLRVCRALGARPQLIASSATAANAGEFAEQLTGRPFRWLTESGAPREGRHVLLMRPATSSYTSALDLLMLFLAAGLKTIVFTKARRITELLYSWLRRRSPEMASRVRSYRSGFLAEERRKIEADLFAGSLDGVISTSALEMGIDVGGLDACILVGYPGSVMATWQRSGRVGRGDRESLTALVALPDALDQYLVTHPQELVGRPCERLIADPGNEPISKAHLVCAAAEMPLSRQRDRRYLEAHAAEVGDLLRSHDLVEETGSGDLMARRKRPQRLISLRGAGESCAIIDEAGTVVGTVDGVRVLHECHPGAVYLHAGRQYLVRELDLDGKKVRAEAVSVDYYTTPMTEKETDILEVLEQRTDGPLSAWLGRLRVTERVVGYQRKRLKGQDLIDQHGLELPPVRYETVGFWWVAPAALEERIREAGEHFLGSLHAVEHAAISLLPLLALCDRGDIGGISMPLHPQVQAGCVFVYDGHPGGVGIANRAFERLPELLERVLDLLGDCPCEDGCPSCIQSPKCGNGNRPLDKAGAAHVLRLLLGREESPGSMTPPRLLPMDELEDEEEAAPPDLPASEESLTTGTGRAPAEAVAAPVTVAPVEKRVARSAGRAKRGDPARDTVLFDLETRLSAADVGGWNKAHRMRVAIAVVYHLEAGRFEVFSEEEVDGLLAVLTAADLVIGFNTKRFDYQVLSGYSGLDYKRSLRSLDLLEEVHRSLGFRLSLDHLAGQTLGAAKSADGLQSLEWVKQGRFDLVEEYCRHDVEILRDLYLFGRRMGYVCYADKQGRKMKLPVDW